MAEDTIQGIKNFLGEVKEAIPILIIIFSTSLSQWLPTYIWIPLMIVGVAGIVRLYAVNTEDVGDLVGIERPKPNYYKCTAVIIGTLVLNLSVDTGANLVFPHTHYANQDAVIAMFKDNVVTMSVMAILVAPVMEEIIYRGISASIFFSVANKYFKKENRVKYGIALYLIVPPALFSLGHLNDNWVAFSTYFISGVVYGLVYLYTRRIWVSMVAHGINNALAVLMLLYTL